MTKKELTEQAFELYYQIKNLNGKGVSLHRAKRLSHATDKARQRYDRRLKTWWASKL
ncbi:MAG: hypothetical protein QX203_10465 [Methylococcaceae bacterium]